MIAWVSTWKALLFLKFRKNEKCLKIHEVILTIKYKEIYILRKNTFFIVSVLNLIPHCCDHKVSDLKLTLTKNCADHMQMPTWSGTRPMNLFILIPIGKNIQYEKTHDAKYNWILSYVTYYKNIVFIRKCYILWDISFYHAIVDHLWFNTHR